MILPIIAAAIVVVVVVVVDAFAPTIVLPPKQYHPYYSSSIIIMSPSSLFFPLAMSGDETTEQQQSSSSSSSSTTAKESDNLQEGEDPAAETKMKEKKKQDKLVKELQESISSLESSLQSKKIQLSNLKDTMDKYSTSGYARQVALVENNKRMRGANNADTTSMNRASVLSTFVPMMEEFDTLGNVKYNGNTFAQTLHSGLKSELNKAMKELNVLEYGDEYCGKMMNNNNNNNSMGRVIVIDEEYSEEYERGTVLRLLKSGLEIQGNVIRPAEVVRSLGIEGGIVEEEKEDAGNNNNNKKDTKIVSEAVEESDVGGDAGEVLSE